MTDGVDTIRSMREHAENVVQFTHPDDEPPVQEEFPPHGEEPPMPEDEDKVEFETPVKPLGVSGDLYFYLDELGQLRTLKARDHNRLNLMSLFGRSSTALKKYWPRLSQDKDTKEWKITGWKPEDCGETLMTLAAQKGVWTPKDRVCGGGAWPGSDGELILHVGDKLLIVASHSEDHNGVPWQERAPGVIDNKVYPTSPQTMMPHMDRQPAGDNGPAQEALEFFRKWTLRRPGVDEYLLLGWVGCAMLSGALEWRPLLWITGGKGTGKSTLQKAICWMMGDGGILHTSDPTAAGIRQILKYAAHPVAIDEAEAEEDGRRMNTLIKLARDAATGALAVRGGSDHEAAQFNLYSCFLFGSILIPPLLPQDLSRLAVVGVGKIHDPSAAPKATAKTMGVLGSRLMRRLVDNWYRFNDVIEIFQFALGEAGHDARGQAVFGTLLAVADLMLHNDNPESDSLEKWKAKFPAESLAETAGEDDDAHACLSWMLTVSIESTYKGRRENIGDWIRVAAGFSLDGDQSSDDIRAMKKVAANALGLVGIKIHTPRKDPNNSYLAVSHKHVGLSKVFDKTQWGTRPGANGVWRQSLGRLCEKIEHESVSIYVGGTNGRATLIPLGLCLPKDGGDEQ